jgi:hypothetical protein
MAVRMKKSLWVLLLATALGQGAVFYSVAATAQSAGVAPSGGGAAAAASQAAHGYAGASGLLTKYCLSCHGGEHPSGDFSLAFSDENEARGRGKEFWDRVATELSSSQMPPARAKNKPTPEEREMLLGWVNRDLRGIAASCEPDPGPFRIHRLNNREYANTVRDLLYLPADWNAAADFPADERGDGFDTNSDTLTISPVLIEHYLNVAEKSASFAMNIYGKGSPQSQKKLRAPQDAMARDDYADRQSTIRLNMQVILPRAYRRPVSKEEIDEIMRFAGLSFTHDGELYDKATSLCIRAALMSPEFLFRMERDPNPDGSGKPYRIGEFELASRLSYFLWASMPDDPLFLAAQDGKLRADLNGHLQRMLKDPRAISLTRDFMGQWLEIRGLDGTANCPPELILAMKGETEHFFNYIVTQDRSIMEFLNSDYTFVNQTLAEHYGIADIKGGDFQKVQVNPDQRGGIFTQASFLTLTGKPLGSSRRTSPVNRGKWIIENIFNQKIPPPPPTVPSLEIDDGKELKGTVRQIFEQHREDPNCAGCHARMDPYGFALENYDGFGVWRMQDNKIDVDASGEVDGRKFSTPKEFRSILAARQGEFRRAFVTKLLGYALGRGVEEYDKPAIDQICAAVEKDGDRFSSVILNIVQSYPFQHARGSSAKAADGGAAEAKK